MNKLSTQKIAYTAMLAAMVCIATMIFKLPTTNGYIHLGDAFVILSGLLLGPIYGALSAGIGTMLADILAGYPAYAIASFVIKASSAFFCGLLYQQFYHKTTRKSIHSLLMFCFLLINGVIVVCGYFLFEAYLLDYGIASAASGIPGNLLQVSAGGIITFLLYPVFARIMQHSLR